MSFGRSGNPVADEPILNCAMRELLEDLGVDLTLLRTLEGSTRENILRRIQKDRRRRLKDPNGFPHSCDCAKCHSDIYIK